MTISLINSYGPLHRNNKKNFEQLINELNNLIGSVSTDYNSLEKIETEIKGIKTILNSNDINLDTVQEIVDAIKDVKTSLDSILVNDLTTGGTTKALTAEQGKILKGLIDSLEISNISGLQAALDLKANATDVYTKTEINNTLSVLNTHRVLTDSATLTATDRFVDFTSGTGKTITLHTFTSVPAGQRYVVEIANHTANLVTVNLGSTTDIITENTVAIYKLDSVGDWSVLV